METCYRHPGRETGVACSSCERPICPDCMTTTPVGMRCPECARQRTKVRTARTLQVDPILTYALIAVNVLVAVATIVTGEGIGGAGGDSPLVNEGALSRDGIADGGFWRLVTSGFLHAGLPHLLMNMFALYLLGTMLEPAIGRWRFAAIYLVSMLAGSFGALLLEPTGLTVGASGAIFGLFGAAFVLMRARGINPMETGLGAVILLNLLITFALPDVLSVGGHVGGLIGGGLAAAALEPPGLRRRVPRAVPPVLVVALGAVLVAGSLAVASAPA